MEQLDASGQPVEIAARVNFLLHTSASTCFYEVEAIAVPEGKVRRRD